jgi:hypothetical protein
MNSNRTPEEEAWYEELGRALGDLLMDEDAMAQLELARQLVRSMKTKTDAESLENISEIDVRPKGYTSLKSPMSEEEDLLGLS